MNFTHNENRRMLQDTLGRWLADNYNKQFPVSGTQANMDSWRALAELGILYALVPEENGGLGGDGHDIALVFEELGKALVTEPWLSALISARLLALADRETALEKLLTGQQIWVYAHAEPDAGYDRDWVQCTAQPQGEGWCLNGVKSVVDHGGIADHLLVSARLPDGQIAVFDVPGNSPGLTRMVYPTIDGLSAANLTLREVNLLVEARLDISHPHHVADAYAILALGAEALGIMDRVQEITLDYLKTRQQFGRPLGSFQALQHRMVKVATLIAQTRSLVINANNRFGTEGPERDKALAGLKMYVGEAGRHIAEEALQLHGAIGLTTEMSISHYAKRLVMIDHRFGDSDTHLTRYVSLMRDALC